MISVPTDQEVVLCLQLAEQVEGQGQGQGHAQPHLGRLSQGHLLLEGQSHQGHPGPGHQVRNKYGILW